jgi:hypothetical protein
LDTRFGGALATGAALVVLLAIEWLGLVSGTLGLVLIGAVIMLALVTLLVGADLKRAGIYAACASCFTLTWNGWFVGPVRPGDVLILVALICFVMSDPNGGLRTPPWWVKQVGVLVFVVAVANIAFPPDAVYLSQRVVLNALGQPSVSTKGSLAAANIGVALKFVVAVVAVPMAFTAAARVDRRAVRWLAIAFGGGAAVSGTSAFLDYIGISASKVITGIPAVHGRQLGLSDHPNFLAAGLVLGVPLALWLVASRMRRDRLLGLAMLPGLFLGVFASGSRGGAVCVVLAAGLAVVLIPRLRRFAPGIALGGAIVVGLVVAAVPSLGAAVLRVTRLSGGVATQGSDVVRATVGAQGLRDFRHSPIQGIGLQVSTEASQVYIQELAAGGLILFAAMSIYSLGGMIAAARLIRRYDLAAALLAALIVTLALNIFEADLTDRFYYVPAAILVALLYVANLDARSAEDAESAEEGPPAMSPPADRPVAKVR